MKLQLILISFSVLIINGCNLINPEESIPSFVAINAMNVAPHSGYGSSASKIKDVWVYGDGQYIGTFELPAKFPVMLEGNHVFTFGAGIFNNGIASTRVKYPFYQFNTRNLTLTSGQTTFIDTITVNYFDSLNVQTEDFESNTLSLDTLSSSLAPLAFDTQNAFEGNKCLKLQVGTQDSVLECRTINPTYIQLGERVYIELNYKCDQKFSVGLMSNLSSTSKAIVLIVNPSAEWNKIYIDITQQVKDYGLDNGYEIYFLLKRQAGAIQNTVYIDNLKFIHD